MSRAESGGSRQPFLNLGAAARPYRAIMVPVLLIMIVSGCVTPGRNALFLDADREFSLGNYSGALKIIEDNRELLYRRQDQLLYALEAGMLSYWNGKSREAVDYLESAERLLEEYYTRSIRQAAGSLLINDLQLDYGGEDFEDIYTNVFKALGYLDLGATEAAFVEIRRISDKLNLLEDKYLPLARAYRGAQGTEGVDIEAGSSRFYNSALARYLSLLLYRAAGNADGVRIDWQQLQEAFRRQPELYPFPLPLPEEAGSLSRSPRLSVIAFIGRSPMKLASTLWIETYENLLVISAASEQSGPGHLFEGTLSFQVEDIKPGYRFKFEIPRMEMQGSEVQRIRVTADGRLLGELSLLEDMQRITVETFSIKEPMILFRSALRTVFKGVAGEAAGSGLEKAGADSGSPLLNLLGYLAKLTIDITAEVSEQADLRVSRYFPAFAHAGEWELPPGRYAVRVEYYGRRGLLHTEDLGSVEVQPGKVNLLTTSFGR